MQRERSGHAFNGLTEPVSDQVCYALNGLSLGGLEYIFALSRVTPAFFPMLPINFSGCFKGQHRVVRGTWGDGLPSHGTAVDTLILNCAFTHTLDYLLTLQGGHP